MDGDDLSQVGDQKSAEIDIYRNKISRINKLYDFIKRLGDGLILEEGIYVFYQFLQN